MTYVKNNNKTSGSYFAQLTNTPANFGQMLTLTLDVRARTTGRVDDNTVLLRPGLPGRWRLTAHERESPSRQTPA